MPIKAGAGAEAEAEWMPLMEIASSGNSGGGPIAIPRAGTLHSLFHRFTVIRLYSSPLFAGSPAGAHSSDV